MYSWHSLLPIPLKAGGNVTDAFRHRGVLTYQEAARFVCHLPYQRNSDINDNDSLVVLRQKCGTCSTKHALLRRLAVEQDIDIVLVLGVFEMDGHNTPGVQGVLEKYGLAALPEAHCYLRSNDQRVDVTRDRENGPLPSLVFLHEEDIAPEQIGDYKLKLHRRFLGEWASRIDAVRCRDVEDAWRIREECIRALSFAPVEA